MKSSRRREAPEPGGTSVVVLVDFSRSFVALKQEGAHARYEGLLDEDRHALDTVAGAIAELASRYWTPPVKVVWTRIQSSSAAAEPLCAPLEPDQKLVKPKDSVGTREEIEVVLRQCVADVMTASRDKRNLADYTDISGALAMASEMASGHYSHRVLIVLSDFHEDLRRGTTPAAFQLHGERVIFLHRPGTDEPENVAGYLQRITGWKDKLLQSGAAGVSAVPVFAVSDARVRAALRPENVEPGTALTVLVDFKENVLTSQNAAVPLLKIGRTLAALSRNWPAPVTAQWVAVRSSAFFCQPLQALDFGPSLIKKENALNTIEEFSAVMEEMAQALPARGKQTTVTDLSGTLALLTAFDPTPKAPVLVVISDFVDGGPTPPAPFHLSLGARVAMLHKPSPADSFDANAYVARRREWADRFRRSGAADVCQIPLVSLTENDLRWCLTAGRQP